MISTVHTKPNQNFVNNSGLYQMNLTSDSIFYFDVYNYVTILYHKLYFLLLLFINYWKNLYRVAHKDVYRQINGVHVYMRIICQRICN